jgi:hypothetical protein
MQRNALFLFVSALFLFGVSVGVLLTRPAVAQGATFYAVPGLPHQSDFWSYSANAADWFTDPGSNVSGWRLLITPDSKNRLPVLVAVHGISPLAGSDKFYTIYRRDTDSGELRIWVTGANQLTGSNPTVSAQLNQSPGVLLQPGEYVIVANGLDSTSASVSRALLASGFWAKP